MRKLSVAWYLLFIVIALFVVASQYNLFNHPASASSSPDGAPGTGWTLKEADVRLLVEMEQYIQKIHLEGKSVTTQQLMIAAAKGMVDSLDDHSYLFTTKQEAGRFDERLRGNFTGIGAYVNLIDGMFTIVRPIYSGPAAAAGLRSRDVITEVDGVSIMNKKLEESVRMLRGKPGTEVRIKVMRRGWTKEREFVVTRARVKIDSVKYEMMPGKVGLVRLETFGADTPKDMENALVALEKNGMRALILDVRGNGGGLFLDARKIVDKFLGAGKLIVYSVGRDDTKKPREDYFTVEETTHPDYPIAVLVNRSSASASEIVAGSLQDHKRATVIGKTTYGKGTVQGQYRLQNLEGAKLTLTIAKYYLPSGRSVHKKGVTPDIEVDVAEPTPWWELQEIQNLQDTKAFEKYIAKYYEADKPLFFRLADYDGNDPNRYPDFEAWYKSTGTKASAKTVRRALREQLRRRISDDRKREFFYNLQEDLQLQRAVLTVLDKLQNDPTKIAEYRFFANDAKKTAAAPKTPEPATP